MFEGNKLKLGLISALAAGGLFASATTASAADFGGNCCADLEERIAELEATTVRKGNRKVSLTISGWVSYGVMWWDEGTESNTYIVQDSTDLATNISFSGSAQIASGWSAGFLINVFPDDTNALAVNQNTDDAGFGFNIQRAYWWIKSDQLGQLSVGLRGGAADNAVILTDFTGTLFQHNTVTFEAGSFLLTPKGGTRSTGVGLFGGSTTGLGNALGSFGALVMCNTIRQGIGNDCLGDRTNVVRWDSPTWGGFSVSGNWGEDDRWDATGRYAGEGGGFKYSFAASYGEVNGDNDFLGTRTDFTGVPIDSGYFQVGGTIKHLATNLWVHGAWHSEDTDNVVLVDGTGWYLKAGWSPKLNPLGRTHFVAEYRENEDTFGAAYQQGSGDICLAYGTSGGNIGAACGGLVNAAIDVTGSEVKGWGLGLVQEIDAASMNLWIKYRHYESEIDFVNRNTGVTGNQEFEDIDLIFGGAHIFF